MISVSHIFKLFEDSSVEFNDEADAIISSFSNKFYQKLKSTGENVVNVSSDDENYAILINLSYLENKKFLDLVEIIQRIYFDSLVEAFRSKKKFVVDTKSANRFLLFKFPSYISSLFRRKNRSVLYPLEVHITRSGNPKIISVVFHVHLLDILWNIEHENLSESDKITLFNVCFAELSEIVDILVRTIRLVDLDRELGEFN